MREPMTEYFILSISFAAPFFSDEGTGYIEAESPEAALTAFAAAYRHPAGLYAANCYASADAYHKDAKPLAQWLSNHEIAKRELTANLGSFSYLGHGPGDFEIGDQRHHVDDPKGGRVVL